MLAGAAPSVYAQELIRGNYYWYVPEHETYSKTQFFSQPRFDVAQVRITRTQRFRLVAGSRGWFMLEFDIAGKAFIHTRLLRNIVYDPTATDTWYEFKRASVFAEEPSKIEARLKAAPVAASTPQTVDSKVPTWKRYKESWNIRGSRTPTTAATEATEPGVPATGSRAPEKKPRSKYPLLPPIGSEPAREVESEQNPQGAVNGGEPRTP